MQNVYKENAQNSYLGKHGMGVVKLILTKIFFI